MKNLKIVGLVAGFIVVAALVLAGAWKLSGQFEHKQDIANKPTIAKCAQKGQQHIVILKNDKATPSHTDGKLCDTLKITNEDATGRLVAFGQHDHHQPYDGVTEQGLEKEQSLTVTMNKTGTFEFHDHIGDIVKGNFTVTN